MTKKPTGKETEIKQSPKKPVAHELQDDELQDDELQQVSGGLAASRPAVAADPVSISKL